MRTAPFILAGTLFLAVSGYPATLYVPDHYPTIQGAIAASMDGDTIIVRPGTYKENIDFIGKAILVTSEKGTSLTVIDGQQKHSVVTFSSGEDCNSVLEGFTVTNGWGTHHPYYGKLGGGILCMSASPMIRKNFITGSSAGWGGGIACLDALPQILGNTIANNKVQGAGAGIACINAFAHIGQNVITNNYAYGIGGGIHGCEQSSPTITANVISWNNAHGYYDGGGGIYCGKGHITNNIIFENWGGDMYGGGIYCGEAHIVNNTVFGNSVGNGGGGIYGENATVVNTIVWDNEAFMYPELHGTLTVTYCDVKGGWPGTGNIDSDPLFLDAAGEDFHLTHASPCRGVGDNTAAWLPVEDFEGDPRIAQGTVDMGADEFHTHLYCMGDLTPGGIVQVKFVGLPGTVPVGLCIGTGILDPPLPSMWGDWFLQFPIIGPIPLGSIPSPEGILTFKGILPGLPPAPYSIPMQALIGGELSNLCVMEVL